MKVTTFSNSIKGSSHIANGKPMQDWSEHSYIPKCNADIILVSDGHGSDKHFRSDRGAKFAVEAAKESIEEFLGGFTPTLEENSLVRRGIQGVKDTQSEDYTPKDINEREFRQLFENIKFRWCEKVVSDWKNDPPTEEELLKANTYGKPIDLSYYKNGKELKAYGCTLIAAVRTPTYWMAFQLGDGKCIAFKDDGSWYEPIPWDSHCFLTTTTSLCQEGSESFRYCYGSTSCPALFIGSDGMDDSYMPLEKLAEFYSVAIRVAADRGMEYAGEQLSQMMPHISEEGSHDDVSIAFWLDLDSLAEFNSRILAKRVERLEEHTTVLVRQKKEAESKCEEIAERDRHLHLVSEQFEKKRESLSRRREEIMADKVKAEEDFNEASFRYEAAKKNLNQVGQALEELDTDSADNERAYETTISEIRATEDSLSEIKNEIASYDKEIEEEMEELAHIRTILKTQRSDEGV